MHTSDEKIFRKNAKEEAFEEFKAPIQREDLESDQESFLSLQIGEMSDFDYQIEEESETVFHNVSKSCPILKVKKILKRFVLREQMNSVRMKDIMAHI